MADETANNTNATGEEPHDYGDGKPAVSLGAGSYDGDKLAEVLDTVDHTKPGELSAAVESTLVPVEAIEADVEEEEEVKVEPPPVVPNHAIGLAEDGSNGYYTLTVPWLEEPVRIRGKAKAEEERDRLAAEGPPADWTPPAGDTGNEGEV